MVDFKFDVEVEQELVNISFSRLGDKEQQLALAVKQGEDKELDGSLKDLVRVRRHLSNLCLMAFMWVASSFCYYLIGF